MNGKHSFNTPLNLLIAYFVITLFAPSFVRPQEGTALVNLEKDINRLIELVKPAVVTVSARLSYSYVESSGPNILGFLGTKEEHQTIEYTNIGSGIVINQQGHILTKASIVENGHGLMVTFFNGRTRPAELLGLDRQTGLAVIKVDEQQVQPAICGDSDQLKPGSWITIVGNSLGVSPAVSFGLVNSIRDDGLVQICADVSPGNSGSPIFNVHGQVVGVLAARIGGMLWPNVLPTMFSGGENALAYPINDILGLAANLAEYGTRPEGWLGVAAEDLPGRSGMVHIYGVFSSGPADKAGIRVGDIVKRIDGRRFSGAWDLAKMIKNKLPGDEVILDVLRGSETKPILITVEQNPQPEVETAKRVQISEQLADPGILTTEWQFQSSATSTGEVSPEFLLVRIRQLERELKVLKAKVQSQ